MRVDLDRWVRWYCTNGNGTDPDKPRITLAVRRWFSGAGPDSFPGKISESKP